MVNFSPINCPNQRKERNQKLEKLLNAIFRYPKSVNAHVLYDFLSPTNKLGIYDFVLFIDIPYEKGNYYKTRDNIYLNTLAIAVRKFEEPEVIDADEECLYTEDGLWEYYAEIESDRQALRRFVYDNIPDVRYFDIAIIYQVKAPKCTKTFQNNRLCFNTGINLLTAINNAIVITQNKDGRAANCIIYQGNTKLTGWSNFISQFINIAESHTQQGILTKKKVDYITKKKTNNQIEQAKQIIGNKLCIIKGKAGTGKTMTLLRLMYDQVRKGADAPKHNCRLLTFNNMLVMDLKMMMKNIGDFTPTKVSISSIHKFFYDIYKVSPVRYLHMDTEKTNAIFNLCLTRILRFNSLILLLSKETKISDFKKLIDEIPQKENYIKDEEKSEYETYQKYLLNKKVLFLTSFLHMPKNM